MIIPFSRLAGFICESRRPGRPYIVGIDGMSASGKSTFAGRLQAAVNAFGHECCIIAMDELFSPELHGNDAGSPYPGFDMRRIESEIIAPLKDGKSVRFHRYDKEIKAIADWREVPANAVILLEGVFTTGRLLGDRLDLRLWLDCPRETVLERGEARSGTPRAEWESRWLPAEDAYIAGEAPEGASDLTIDGSWHENGVFRTVSIKNSRLAERMKA